jgi:2-phosphosulfolactate phosphatase
VRRTIVIDFLPEAARRYGAGWAVVAIDIMRATTTAVTAVHRGRRCFPVPTPEAAHALAARLERPLLVGEFGGELPDGFDAQNSPALMASDRDLERPVVLVSSSGTRLLHEAAGADAVYAACLRNARAQAEHLAEGSDHRRVAVIGAGTKGAFRSEDQLGCARVAERLLAAGFEAGTDATTAVVERWRDRPAADAARGRSAAYLRRTGQLEDLEFVVTRIDDVDAAYRMDRGELRELA